MSRTRRSTGGIYERQTSRGISYHIRFRAAGERQSVFVGNSADGVTRQDAARVLSYELERVNRGEWKPPAQAEVARAVPTFHEAASDWFAARKVEGGRSGRGLSARSVADLEWRLGHLLREFSGVPLDRIDVAAVDKFRRRLVREGSLGPRSINRLLETLASVIEEALDQGLIDGRNPAVGRRRRLPVPRPPRAFLDRAEHIEALLDAAGTLDSERPGVPYRRAAIAMLLLGGLRIGEMLNLRWSDVHLASGRLHVRAGKNDTAERTVDLLPLLHEELTTLAAHGRDSASYVFPTRTGGCQNRSNIRRRVLTPSVERANERLTQQGAEPLPRALTHHALRRTYASILYATREDPASVMDQMGHLSADLALEVYAKAIPRRERDRIGALVGRPYREITGNGVHASELAQDLGRGVTT
jgi:integrase